MPDELRAALHAARDDATRRGEAAGDLLQLATVSGEAGKLVLTTVDLADLVESVVQRVASLAEHAGIREADGPRLVLRDRVLRAGE